MTPKIDVNSATFFVTFSLITMVMMEKLTKMNKVSKSLQQSGAEEACWAHNPEVGGSKPPSATYNFSTWEQIELNDMKTG